MKKIKCKSLLNHLFKVEIIDGKIEYDVDTELG